MTLLLGVLAADGDGSVATAFVPAFVCGLWVLAAFGMSIVVRCLHACRVVEFPEAMCRNLPLDHLQRTAEDEVRHAAWCVSSTVQINLPRSILNAAAVGHALGLACVLVSCRRLVGRSSICTGFQR